jgi:hypothetical protein
VGDDHFSKTRINQRLKTATEKGKILRHELAAQKIKGVDRTSASRGMVKYTAIKKPDGENKGHIEQLQKEMEFRGLTSKDFKELEAKKQWTGCLLNWLMKNETERVSKIEGATAEDIAQAKKMFLPLSDVSFASIKPTKAKAPPPKKRKPLKPLDTNQPKKKAP